MSHGSFAFDNIYQHADALHVPDVDHLCFAPRAYDLATFAVSTISGRSDDSESLVTVVDALNEGYGAGFGLKGDAMNWFLAAAVLTSLDRPLNSLGRDWAERTSSLLSTAEALIA